MYDLLKGIRVLDLTRVWSGPLAGRILADLGAEVIHILGRSTISGASVSAEEAAALGTFPDNEPGEEPWNRMSQDIDFNRNKLGLTLELDTAQGVDLFKRLIAVSDAVIENFSPRVMRNFGLDYTVLKQINPSIIMCSMPGYGLTGPWKDYVSYGVNLDFGCGLASLMGYPGEGPHMSGNPYPDAAAALHAVASLLTALFHKLRTGQGQLIDLSQAESTVSLIGETALASQLNGGVPQRQANRHAVFAPHGCYRCKGEDAWIAIEISTKEQWESFVRMDGMPEQMKNDEFADFKKRRINQDRLDALIETWTLQYTHLEAMLILQGAGVPAGAVLNAAELVENEHLQAREFFLELDHPAAGRRKYCGLPIKFSGAPFRSGRPSPLLGEHNSYVLKHTLGLSDEEVLSLEEKGVIGTEPID